MKQTSIGVLFLALVLIVNGALWAAPPDPKAKPPAKTEKAPENKEPGTAVPSLGNDHIQSIESPHPPYNSKPPTSGPHVPFVARWGIYDRQVPNELQVHNLEDGGVIIQYDCKNCTEMVQKIETLAKEYFQKAQAEGPKSRYGHLLVGPYAGLDTPIALTAWGKIDKLNEFDEARIRRFIEAYIGIDHHPSHE